MLIGPSPQRNPLLSRMPLSRFPLSNDTAQTLLRSLTILQSLGESIPAGGLLKTIAGIGITLLEVVETARVNKAECLDIAERAARNILTINSQLALCEHMPEDLKSRLEVYRDSLAGVANSVERLCAISKTQRALNVVSVQEETRECQEKLSEAYQTYNFRSSVATDCKLNALMRGLNALCSNDKSYLRSRPGEPDEIPVRLIEFGNEIGRDEKEAYILRVESGELRDPMGNPKAVVLRRFEAKLGVEDPNPSLEEFQREVKIRGDLLHQYFARMLGVASSITGRTNMIVIEADTIIAYDYLQSLSGLDYFLEHSRIMCEFVAGYSFLREHGGSWRGGYQEVLLSTKDKRLCMGGLGRIDGHWMESSWRMNEAFWRLRDGSDLSGTWSESSEYYAEWLAQARESLSRWSEEKTEENARVLWKNLWLWRGSYESERRLANPPPVGEIGYIKGKVWHPLPLVHQFPLADRPQYTNYAFRWRDGEWEQISGSRVKEFTRWSIDVAPGEEVYLHTFLRIYRSGQISSLFRACALSLARDFGVDVRSLRLLSRAGFYVDTSITRLKDQPSTMHYFSYPSNPDGTVPNPPGFWSFSSDPLCSDESLQAQDAQAQFHVQSCVQYARLTDPVVSILQELDSHGFLPVLDLVHARSLQCVSSKSTVPRQHTSSLGIAERRKKIINKMLLSAFVKLPKCDIPKS